MIMTFDEYDAFIEKIEEIDTPAFWPTPIQIEIMEEDPDKWIKYLSYVLEKCSPPEKKEDEYSMKNINAFLRKNLKIV